MEETTVRAAADAIRSADHLSLACHVGPDGDALGSMLGLAVAARAAGREVVASFGQPFEVPDTMRFLPVDVLASPDQIPDEPDTFVCFDTGSADRLGELGLKAQKAETVVVVDHHVTNEGFGDIALVRPDASSTAELTLGLLRRIGWPITPDVATCLLTGIVTDTGRFQYSNTGPRTFVAAAQLVAAGARPEVIGRHVYEETPFGYMAVLSAVAGRTVLEEDRRFVWSVLYPDDLKEAGIHRNDADGLIDVIRLPKEADVAVLAKVMERDVVKVSLRSRGRVDVGSIAAELGGGGHHNASGFTFQGTVDDAVAAVRSRLSSD